MKKNTFTKAIKRTSAFFLMSALLMESAAAPLAYASQPILSGVGGTVSDVKTQSSLIQKVEGISGIDYTDYVDNSVMFQLPEGIADDQEISVIVTVDVANLMDAYEGTDKTMSFAEFALESDEAADIKKQISEEKTQILNALDEQGVEYATGEDYATVLSGFEVVIKAGDFAATCQSLTDGADVIVGEEYEVCETEVVENTVNVYDTGIFNSSESGYDGSGMVVAVLDTGLDSNHTAFSVDNFTSDNLGLTYEDVAAVLADTEAYELMNNNITVDDVYINEKVPFGFDYADNDTDPYSTHNNHGTHVSGVIVGKDDTITGVAPNAQLVSMKIFSDVVDTARTAWILAALEDCVVLGVDVINMSLGTACGFSRESDEETVNGVYDRIREAGIDMIVAASNSYSSAFGSQANGNLGLTTNPDTGTVGSPSTYEGVMSVASISGVETPYITYNGTIIYYTETTNGAAEENNFLDTLLGEDKDSAELEYIVIPGVGRTADYTGLDVKGKIVLVRRGQNTFEEKAIIAQEQGAAGIIIYNNVSGDIKMNVGDATLAVCSISQDDGEMLAAQESGKLVISREQTSGPFISDFSSWGPTPDLRIKPEITAHGGSILSSVTGGSYERLSGTSMACPNLAGVVILLKQYVVENFPEIADDNNKVNEMVNRLLMSTADIAFNKNGSPYAVRKQGAGLANLASSIETTAYLTTYDSDGNVMDKTKIELGDDPDKNGVYELKFTINNFGSTSLSYDVGAYVMTEGVSDTKTNSGKTTVTEEAYILGGAEIKVSSVTGGTLKGSNVTVEAGKNAEVVVTITLSDEDKKYLDDSFANGMYVEGFVTLTATSGTEINLNVPYLAYYGNWTVAPLFDLEYFDTNADELDDGIDVEDKTMADAYATRPVGGVTGDYVSYLGSYYFLQDPDDMVIAADKDHISLSNQEGTLHTLRYVWAGLLRNAATVDITITDDATGEVIFEKQEVDIRKSYGDGGSSIYPANIEIEFDTFDYNLKNNSTYTVNLKGTVDYGDGGVDTNLKNEFEFPLTIDFEAPTVTDVEYTYEYDETLKKNRLYAKVAVYDNHYSMAAQLGYVTEGTDDDGNAVAEMKTFEQYMTPIYSERNNTTYITYELTDYIYEIKENATNKNSFLVTCYDYALNYASYEIQLPDDFTDFYLEGMDEGITLSPNEVYSLDMLVYPTTEWGELLKFSSSKASVVRVVNNKLVAVKPGKAVIKVQDPTTNESITFNVTVLDEEDEGYRKYDKPVVDIFTLDGYETLKAYYMVSNDEKEIGDTGSINFFEGDYSLSLYPSESVYLNYSIDAYFPKDTTVEYESSNEAIVEIDEYGTVTAKSEGFASVTIKVIQDDMSTYYSYSISVEVKDPYVTSGATLTHYYGNGGLVSVPEDLSLTEIGAFAFANFEYVEKTEEELLFDDAETTKQWYIGEDTITKVIIPEGVKKINQYAFANLTALEEIVLPSTLEAIEYGAFYGCTSLQKITFSGDNNLKIINQNAFENCDLRGTLELSSACVISDYAFAGNQKLEGLTLSDTILSIGQYAFAGCESLATVTIDAAKVKYGAYVFTGCKALTEFTVNSAVIPEGMFYQCEALAKVTVGADVNDIGAFAFRETNISTYEVATGNKAYMVQSADYILSADGTQLVAVSPTVRDAFTADNIGGNSVTAIAKGAFSHNQKITSVTLPDVTTVGDYGFASCDKLATVALGTLTAIGEYGFFETAITAAPAFDATTAIGKYAFSYTKITSVVIPDDMTVAEGVFSQCLNLESVVIGNNVTLEDFAFNMDKDEAFEIEQYMDGEDKLFRYVFSSALTSLTIGDNAVIGESVFANHASIESVTLGANAEIGYMAFYNMSSLKSIDLSKAKSIADYAFSGDVYNVCLDENMAYAAVSDEGRYIYTYHSPAITELDVSAAESVGAYAFAYCRDLKTATIGANVTELPEYAFAGCESLTSIKLGGVTSIGDYAFMESGLVTLDLSGVATIGEYAFVSATDLTKVTFNTNGADLAEAAFAYCESLKTVENMASLTNIGNYAFAYTLITEADLTAAVTLGDQIFLKEELTPFKVTLGANLTEIGDNPFAMCDIEAFHLVEVETFNGVDYETNLYTYDINENVKVVDGSLYCKVQNGGYELIVYAGTEHDDIHVAEDTVRITSMAFAASDAVVVTLPYTVEAVGHKAFYDCDNLKMVVFTSYNAPVLEEEYDPTYYESYEHIPGSGDYGTYTDYDGTEVQINGEGMLPYYMWNVTNAMYSNVFYGANFVDYVGYVEDKLTLVKPVNGQNYDTYIMNQYFDLTVDGASAADDVTLAAIRAIDAIPDKVAYEDRGLVETARELYSKIATTEQQALVTNYADLVSAEQRITALTPADTVVQDQVTEKKDSAGIIVLIILAILVLIAFPIPFVVLLIKCLVKKEKVDVKKIAKTVIDKEVEILKKIKEKIATLFAKAKQFFKDKKEQNAVKKAEKAAAKAAAKEAKEAEKAVEEAAKEAENAAVETAEKEEVEENEEN